MERDFVGSVSHEGLPAGQVQDSSQVPWIIDTNRAQFHYGSYSLLIGPRILASDAFARFWQRFSPTNNKNLTVRRGEIGLTRWILDHGFSHGALYPSDSLDRLLDGLPTERLREITSNLINIGREELVVLRRNALSMLPPDRATLRNVILAYVAYRGPGYAFQDFDIRDRGGNFVKKAPLRWSRDAAEATLRVLGHFDGPQIDLFRKEAQDMFDATYGGSKT